MREVFSWKSRLLEDFDGMTKELIGYKLVL